MLDKKMLRAAIAMAGYTQTRLAKEIGMSNSTMVRKIKNSSFGTDEAMKIIEILKIKNPEKIFFAK